MKSKTLISLAVASAFGWSAAAFAGPGHEVVTPYSPNESGENIFVHQEGFGSTDHMASIGMTSDPAGGTVSGSVSSGIDHSASFSSDQALSGMDESLALSDEGFGTGDSLALADDGSYSEYYLVSWTPVIVETWDVYLIEPSSDQLALSEEGSFMGEQLASSSFDSMSESSDSALMAALDEPSDEGVAGRAGIEGSEGFGSVSSFESSDGHWAVQTPSGGSVIGD